jgi:DNA-binding NarL/FixJ family response regulator
VAAVQEARRLRPDVILMDIRMPRLDGLQATRQLMSEPQDGPPQRVIILTTFDLDEYVSQALCAGAAGLIVKDISDDDSPRACTAPSAATPCSYPPSPVASSRPTPAAVTKAGALPARTT